MFYLAPMAYNLADLFEHTADVIPDRIALICGDDTRTFGELEARSNRLAHHLAATGIEPGDHVGIYAANSMEWIEALLAIFKIRAVPININYRYVEAELRYLFDNADLEGLVYREEFGPRVAAVIDDAAAADQPGDDPRRLRAPPRPASTRCRYDDALAAGSPERDFAERSGDDIVIIYTGGTTGMPKGVMWRAEDIFYALIGGTDFFTHEKVPDECVPRPQRGGLGRAAHLPHHAAAHARRRLRQLPHAALPGQPQRAGREVRPLRRVARGVAATGSTPS